MAYLTCPDCMMPNPVADDAVKATCFSCYAEIVFETCPDCGYEQSILRRLQRAFTCGRCSARVAIPYARLYSTSTKAMVVQGYGYAYPRS
jgi:ribosomal protein S27E